MTPDNGTPLDLGELGIRIGQASESFAAQVARAYGVLLAETDTPRTKARNGWGEGWSIPSKPGR